MLSLITIKGTFFLLDKAGAVLAQYTCFLSLIYIIAKVHNQAFYKRQARSILRSVKLVQIFAGFEIEFCNVLHTSPDHFMSQIKETLRAKTKSNLHSWQFCNNYFSMYVCCCCCFFFCNTQFALVFMLNQSTMKLVFILLLIKNKIFTEFYQCLRLVNRKGKHQLALLVLAVHFY